jgi:hypothetical protein
MPQRLGREAHSQGKWHRKELHYQQKQKQQGRKPERWNRNAQVSKVGGLEGPAAKHHQDDNSDKELCPGINSTVRQWSEDYQEESRRQDNSVTDLR